MSRAPLVMLEFALRALRYHRRLHRIPLGVLYYLDEGRDCRYSGEIIRQATARAKQVFVLRPGSLDDKVIVQRRGQRKYRLTVEGKPRRPGQQWKSPEVLLWVCEKLQEMSRLSSRKDRIALSGVNIETEAFPMLLPHRVTLDLLVHYLDPKIADTLEAKVKLMLNSKGYRFEIENISDRPPMKERRNNLRLAKSLAAVAEKWEIPFGKESSVWPSAAGLVPAKVPVVCGIGPTARDLYTPQEAINRISLVQRTLLVAEFLSKGLRR
jgi:D-alanine-D-alanine ligase